MLTAAILAVGGYALIGTRSALRALFLVAAVRVLNPAVAQVLPEAGALAWIVVLVASLRILSACRESDFSALWPLLIYAAVVALLAVAASANASISLMKLLTFTLSSAAALVGFRQLEKEQHERIMRWISSLWFSVAALSLPAYMFPSVGYTVNNEGFQGILNHPQAFGVVLAPAAVYFTVLASEARHKGAWILSVSAAAIWAMIFTSHARTAVIAAFFSLVAAVLVAGADEDPARKALRRRLLRLLFFVISLAVIGIVSLGPVRNAFTGFVYKGEEKVHGDVGEAFYDSRGKGVQALWENFLEKPITGHGFQVYPSGDFPGGIKRVWGIPVSASVEKGFVFVAALEETGVVGAAFLLLLLASLYRTVAASNDVRWVAVFLSCLFVNFGEGVFFAAGGLGLYFWLLIGLCASRGRT